MKLSDFDERGSFRGVGFWARRRRGGGGRRLVIDQFNGEERGHSVQDLGAKTGKFQELSCFVVGDGVFEERKRLEEALDAPGKGRLVHPWIGSFDVFIEDWTVDEDASDLGDARFDVVYVKVGEEVVLPTSTESTAQETDAAATATVAVSETDLGDSLVTEAQPNFVLDSAADGVRAAADALENLRGRVPEIPEKAREYSLAVQKLFNEAASLVRVPFELAAAITGAVNQAAAIAQVPGDALYLYRNLRDFSLTLPDFTDTPARAQELENLLAIQNLVRRSAVSEGARATIVAEYSSRESALGTMNEWTAAIADVELDATGETFQELGKLKAALVRDLSIRAAKLPSVTEVQILATLPALVLANKLYGHANVEANAADLVARNDPENSNFMPEGVPLEVLGG